MQIVHPPLEHVVKFQLIVPLGLVRALLSAVGHCRSEVQQSLEMLVIYFSYIPTILEVQDELVTSIYPSY